MAAELGYALNILIKLLLIPVLVLAGILLYRLDRVVASGMHSAEMIERTAENVERSSETFVGLVSLLEKIPFVSSGGGGGKDE